MSKALTRVDPRALLGHEDPRDEPLAAEVTRRLGYTGGEEQLHDTAMKMAKLRDAMVTLDVRPFDPKRVDKYKKSKAYDHDRSTRELLLNAAVFFGIVCFVFTCAMLISLVGTIVCFFASYVYALWPTVWAITAGVALLSFLGTLNLERRGKRDRQWWENDALASYAKPIPDYALQTALDLDAACRAEGATNCNWLHFGVDELCSEKVTAFATLDPFLYIDVPDGRRIYIEVWDEAKFGAKRLEVDRSFASK